MMATAVAVIAAVLTIAYLFVYVLVRRLRRVGFRDRLAERIIAVQMTLTAAYATSALTWSGGPWWATTPLTWAMMTIGTVFLLWRGRTYWRARAEVKTLRQLDNPRRQR